jgi:hypothetical protein
MLASVRVSVVLGGVVRPAVLAPRVGDGLTLRLAVGREI